MSNLSRRDLVVLAGAGLALAGCNRKDGTANGASAVEAEAQNTTGADPKFFAPCEDYGDSPKGNPPGNPSADDFKPPYICVIYIAPSPNGWGVAVNYASFEIVGENNQTTRLQKALAVLKEKLSLGRTFAHLTQNIPTPGTNGSKDQIDLKHFGFKSQHELFFFFHDEVDAVDLDPNYQVVFAKRSFTPGKTISKNDSFYRALYVDLNQTAELAGKGEMFRLENHVIPTNGVQTKHYSMNVHYIAKSAAGKVPMVVDPDTGNGYGYEP